jgi:hypothetical protein
MLYYKRQSLPGVKTVEIALGMSREPLPGGSPENRKSGLEIRFRYLI